MTDDSHEFGDEILTHDLLPEDLESLARAVDVTRDILSAPREARHDLIDYALEAWELLHASFSDPLAVDQVGEVMELLNQIARERSLSFQESQRGKTIVRTLAQFFGLAKRNGWRS